MRLLTVLSCCCFYLVLVQGAQAASDLPAPANLVVQAARSRIDVIERAEQARSGTLRAAWLKSGQVLPLDATVPSITAGTVLTPVVFVGKAPAAPAVDLGFSTGPAGVSSIEVEIDAPDSSQHLVLSYDRSAWAPALRSGLVIIQSPAGVFDDGARETLGPYSKAGKWTVDYITICDAAGNCRIEFPKDLAPVFKSNTVQVINPDSDGKPPVAIAGRVLTPKISLSSPRPIFAAQLTASDDRSGYAEGTVFILPPGSLYLYGYATQLPAPMASGTVTTYVPLRNPYGPLTGTWSIVGYEVCDVPGNCTDDYSAPDIKTLFGTTTFEVTN